MQKKRKPWDLQAEMGGDAATSQGDASSQQKLKRQEAAPPLEPEELSHLISVQLFQCITSLLHSCNRTDFCCSKSPVLHSYTHGRKLIQHPNHSFLSRTQSSTAPGLSLFSWDLKSPGQDHSLPAMLHGNNQWTLSTTCWPLAPEVDSVDTQHTPSLLYEPPPLFNPNTAHEWEIRLTRISFSYSNASSHFLQREFPLILLLS